MNIDPKALFAGLPCQIRTAYEYIRQLKYDEEPEYEYLISLFSCSPPIPEGSAFKKTTEPMSPDLVTGPVTAVTDSDLN